MEIAKQISEISTIAAHLVHSPKYLSSYAEDMPKSTPKSVLKMIEQEENRMKDLSYKLSQVGKELYQKSKDI